MKRIKMIAKNVTRTLSNPQRRAKTLEQNKQLLQPKQSGRKRSEKMKKRLALKQKIENTIKKVRANFKEKIKNAVGKEAKSALRQKRDIIIKNLEKSYTKSYKRQGSSISSKSSKKSSSKQPSKKEGWWKRAINKIKGFFK